MGILPPVFQAIGITGLLIPAVVLLALIFGCALGAILIPAFTVLQEGTTEESRGRIFGGVFTVINASIALPLLAFGGAADLSHSVDGVVDVFGALVVSAGLVYRFVFWSRLLVLDQPAGVGATSAGSTWQPLTRRVQRRGSRCRVRLLTRAGAVASSVNFARRGDPGRVGPTTVEAQGERCEPS